MHRYVIDTNILLHDPHYIDANPRHLYIPFQVLVELDRLKTGRPEIARQARIALRLLEAISAEHTQAVTGTEGAENSSGGSVRLQPGLTPVCAGLDAQNPDDHILSAALSLKAEKTAATLLSHDINLRLRARLLGLSAQTLDAPTKYSDDLDENESLWGQTVIVDDTAQAANGLSSGTLVNIAAQPARFGMVKIHENTPYIHPFTDYTKTSIYGIHARENRQSHALNLLLDPDIDLVFLGGPAGCGKTLLALASGLAQVQEHKRYRQILMTRATIPVGEDIGFLPGTEEEKMSPWMGALDDNLELLCRPSGSVWQQRASSELLREQVSVRSLNYMRGRSIHERFIIVDEAQNLTLHQLKTLLTRAGTGSKMVILGNLAQIDTAQLSSQTSGFRLAAEAMSDWPHAARLYLNEGLRSRLANAVSARL